MSRTRSLVLLASAGTGKTHRLTNRLLALYAGGTDPRRVLASTFTRKAAGEILERLLQRLCAAARSEADAAKLAGEIGAPLDRVAAEQLCARLLRRIDRLRISTLDAWFQERAQAAALELGLPSDWDVGDLGAERRLAGRALSRALAQPRSEQDWSTLISELKRGGAESRVHAGLLESLAKSARFARECTEGAWDFPALPPEVDPAELVRSLAKLAGVELPRNADGEPNSSFAGAVRRIDERIRDGDWVGFAKEVLVQRALDGSAKFSRCEIPRALRDVLRELAVAMARKPAGLVRNQNRSLRELSRDFLQQLDAASLEERWLSFDALPRMLAKHFGASPAPADVEHLLLDEFQDTSSLQWSVLEPGVRAVLDREGASLFCVGDVKQSIYGWREGNPRLLSQLPARLDVPHETMAKSYRSSQEVLDFVRDVFTDLEHNPSLASAPALAAAREFSEAFTPQAAAHALEGRVRLSCGPRMANARLVKPREQARLERGVEVARELQSANPGWRIAFLLRWKKLIPELLERLKQAEIAASGEGGNSLTDSSAVNAALSLLEFADHPDDRFLWFHLATSPLAGVAGVTRESSRDDRLAAAAALRRRWLESGPGALLAELEAPVREHYPAFDQRRFAQLCALAQRLEPLEPLRPARFAERLALERVPDPANARVQVMTIHGAKGLEFDAVILLDLDTSLAARSSPVVARRLGDDPSAPYDVVTHTLSRGASLLIPELHDVQQAAASARCLEELCVLYVALTRAVHHLELLVDYPAGKDPKKSFAGILLHAVGAEKPEQDSLLHDSHMGAPLARGAPAQPVVAEALRPARPRIELEPAAAAPGRVVPSRLAASGRRDSTAELFASSGGGARARGLLWHAWLEQIGWIEDGTPGADELLAQAQRDGLGAADEREAQSFLAALARPEIARELSRSGAARLLDATEGELSLARERKFAFLRDGARGAELVQGAIDRAVVAKARRRAAIVDFKTDALDGTDAELLAARAEHYRPQMELYRSALARLEGLAEPDVEMRLCFLACGKTIVVD